MPDTAGPIIQNNKKSGVTLIEILIVTVIIGLMASLAFPVYKIMQQREKERRLKKILNDVRSAIAGSKSQLSTTAFSEGFRTQIRVQGIEAIKDAHITDPDPAVASAAIATFVLNLTLTGAGYPGHPASLTATTHRVAVATGPTPASVEVGTVTIDLNRRFLRSVPPHPFQGWYPNATWTFQPAYPQKQPAVASSAWAASGYFGIVDIKSKGAGMALDGSNTDEW